MSVFVLLVRDFRRSVLVDKRLCYKFNIKAFFKYNFPTLRQHISVVLLVKEMLNKLTTSLMKLKILKRVLIAQLASYTTI